MARRPSNDNPYASLLPAPVNPYAHLLPVVGPRRSAAAEQRREEEERQREAGRSRDGVLPTVTTTAPAPTVAENAGQFARGVGLGATQSLTSLGEVAGMVPGLGIVGEKSRELEQKAKESLDPQGPYGLGGQVFGRMGGEVFQALKAAGPVAKGIARIAPRAGQAIQAGLEGTRLQRALATTATSAPIDVVQGLKEEEGLLLPGRAGSVAENVLFSGAAGALFRGKPQQRTSIAPTAQRQLPAGPVRDRARLLGAGPDAPMQGPAIPMGGATPGTMQGPAIPMRGVRPEVERITDPSRLLGSGPTTVARSLEAAETGQPFAATLKRGEGKNFVDRPSVVGPARYTTPNTRYAEQFGTVRDVEVQLKNPLVIENDNQWRALTKQAGWQAPNTASLPAAEQAALADNLQRTVTGMGHDGIVVRIPKTTRGSGVFARSELDERLGKTLDRVFGADQVIEFTPPRQPPKASPATETSASRPTGEPITDPSRLLPAATPDDAARRTAQERLQSMFAGEPERLAQAERSQTLAELDRMAEMSPDQIARLREGRALDYFPDDTPRIGEKEGYGAPYTRQTRSVRKMSDRDLALEYNTTQSMLDRLTQAEAVAEARAGEIIGVQADASRTRSANITAAQRRKRTMEKRRPTDETLSGKEKRQLGYDLTEDARGRIEEMGMDPDEYRKMLKDAGEARKRLPSVTKRYSELTEEMERRGIDALPRETGPSSAGDVTDEMREYIDAQVRAGRTGAASPELLTQLGTTGAGAAIGAATTPEGESESVVGRALAGALAGYGVGQAGLAGVRRMGGTPQAAPRGSTPAIQAVNATINTGDRTVQDVPAWLTKRERAYTNLVSETRPLELAAAQGGQKSAMQGAISQAQGSGQAALQYLRDRVQLPLAAAKGQLDDVKALVKARRDLDIRVKSRATNAAVSTEQLEQAVRAKETDLSQARTRLETAEEPTSRMRQAVQAREKELQKARRDLQIRTQGVAKSTVPTEVLEQAVRDGEANEAVRNAADALRDVERDLLRMRHEAGMLTDEAYQAILASEDFYTPFVREFAEDAYQQMGAKGGKWYQRTSGVRRMDRTVDAISQTADPLEVVTASVTRTFRDVGRQRVQNILGDLVEDGSLANVIRVVPGDTPMSDAARVFKQVRGGKQVTYEVLDPELFDAIAAQGKESSNILLRFAQAMKNLKTAGITTMPDFAAANVIRDVAASGIQRPDVKRAAVEAGLGALGGGTIGAIAGDDDKIIENFLMGAGMGAGAGAYARPFAQSLSAMGSIISANLSDAIARGALPANETAETLLNRGAQSYREFLRSGASTEGFYVRTPKDAREVLQRLGAEERASILTPRRWWETLQAIGSVAEQSTRLAAFKQVRETGASLPQAAREAQDRTLRFANVGKATKGLASVTPFWNAKMQGWDKLVRLMKQPKTWGLGTAMLTAPSVSLWNLNKDNPEYWERPIWERNLFWLVPKAEGGFYRVPKPFEIGYLFASIPERALDYLAQQGVLSSAAPATAEPGRAAGRAAMNMATSTLEGTVPVPQVLSLPGQVVANRDLFRNRPIVTRPGLPTELQGTPETSSIARQAAKFGISPEKVDFALRDVAGTTGREALRAVDVVAGSFGAPAPRLDRLTEVPVVGQMQRRFTTQDRGQTESESAARDRLRRIEMVVTGMRELQRGGDQAEMRAYFERNKNDLLLNEQLRELSRSLDQITADRRTVERNRDLPKEERERLLRAIREAGNRVSQQINQMPATP